MKDKDREVLPPMNGDADLPERLWLYDDFTPDEDPPVTDYSSGLASLGFIGAALRRRARTWCGIGLIGFVAGLAYFAVSPPAYQATTTVLLTHSVNEDPTSAMATDLSLAHSDTVAARAIGRLGLSESANSLLASTAVDNLTDRVLQFTVSATSARAATQQAAAMAQAFLAVRASELQDQQKLTAAALQQQITQAQQNVTALTTQIDKLSGATSSADQAKRSTLESERSNAQSALQVLQQNNNGQQATSASNVAAQVSGSQVLDPATAGHHSAAKFAVIYAVMGLVVGLMLGLAIVIIGALVSDKLRRRDDVADALGTSVNLSVGPTAGARGWLRTPQARARQHRDLQRIVAHLRDAVPDRERGGAAAALGIVPADDGLAAARALVATAVALAQDGQNVLVADLAAGAPAARLLKVSGAGVQTATAEGAELTVAVPAQDDVVPRGPVRRFQAVPEPKPDAGTSETPGDALADAYRSADVLLTLAAVDPALGAEHLRTWAGDAVVVVSAGRSSWMRIHTVGEMIRLARIPLVSAILTEADRTDESMGLTQAAVRGTRVARANGL